MSEAVKRYVIRHGCVEEASSLLPGERAFVLAADHDRIVASLQAQVERAVNATNAECNDWAREYELRMAVTAERNKLAERCRELEAIAADAENDRARDASMARNMILDIVAVGEALGIPGEEQEGGVAEFIEAIEHLQQARQERDTLRAEVDGLHVLLKEAGDELKELKASVGFRAHTLDVIQRIDAALDEYDRAVIEAGTEPSVK